MSVGRGCLQSQMFTIMFRTSPVCFR